MRSDARRRRVAGNFSLADASALTVAGNDVAFGSFTFPYRHRGGNSGPATSFSNRPMHRASLSARTTPSRLLSASGTISVQADALNFDATAGLHRWTFEYAPATKGATATLGASGGLDNNVFGIGVISSVSARSRIREQARRRPPAPSALKVLSTRKESRSNSTPRAPSRSGSGPLFGVSTLSGNAASLDLTTNSTHQQSRHVHDDGLLPLTDAVALGFTGMLTRVRSRSRIRAASRSRALRSRPRLQDYNGLVQSARAPR